MSGKVYLCGVGPGDPELATLRAVAVLAAADLIVTDALAPEALLSYARPGAEIVRAGKRAGNHPELPQAEINALLVARARAGQRVVRMKGGDPFVFGRGGEEAEFLADAGVDFEVVPGVTSASAVASYAGIPLTHRDHAQSFAVLTGHSRKAAPAEGRPGGSPAAQQTREELAWGLLAKGADTLVLLMGVTLLEENLQRLILGGRSADTPAALVQWGTTPRQRVLVATLGTLAARAREAGLGPPSVVIIGSVVTLRDKLAWYEHLPLFGKRVLVTRPLSQASALGERIHRLGGEAVSLPTIETVAPASFAPLDEAIAQLPQYQHIVFTSQNGTRFFFERLAALGYDSRRLHGLRIAAIGPATAESLRPHGLRADLVAREFKAESLAEGMIAGGIAGQRVLIARAAVAREVLIDELRAAGAQVDVVHAYQTVVPTAAAVLAERLRAGDESVDALTFTSASTVTHFFEVMGEQAALAVAARAVVACIGPVTRDVAIARGLRCQVMPSDYTIPALCDALAAHFAAAALKPSAAPLP